MNKAYLKHLLKTNKKLLIIQFAAFAVLWGFFNSGFSVNSFFFVGYFNGELDLNYMYLIILKYYFIASAIIYPIYFHLKEYKQNANDLFYALPIKREKRYACELLFIYAIVVIPALLLSGGLVIASIFGVVIWNVIETTLLYILGFSVLYLLNHLLLVKCNNKFDAIVLTLLFNLMLLILPSCIEFFLYHNAPSMVTDQSIEGLAHVTSNGVLSSSYIGASLLFIISPYYFMGSITNFIQMNIYSEINTLMRILIVLYILVSVLLVFLNLIAYKNKKSELNGGKSTSRFGYPLIVTALTSIPFMMFFSNQQGLILLFGMVFMMVCFFVSKFISRRKISFQLSDLVHFFLIIALIYGFRSVYISTDGFGYYKNIYKDVDAEEIEIWNHSSSITVPFEFSEKIDKEKFNKLIYNLEKFQDHHLQTFKDENRWIPQRDIWNQSLIQIVYIGEKRISVEYRVDSQQLRTIKDILQKADSSVDIIDVLP